METIEFITPEFANRTATESLPKIKEVTLKGLSHLIRMAAEAGEYSMSYELYLDPHDIIGFLKSKGFHVERRSVNNKLSTRIIISWDKKPENETDFFNDPETKMVITAKLNDEVVKRKDIKDLASVNPDTFDGLEMDRLCINGFISDSKSIENLIYVLQVAKKCFISKKVTVNENIHK